jgi:DNA-binding MarR family transcriptional regulator
VTLNPIHELLYDLFRAAEEGVSARLSARGWPPLGRAQMSALDVLGEGPTSVAALGRRLTVTRQAAHQTVRQLDDMELISREDDRKLHGARWITLSKKGRHLVLDLADAIEETDRSLEEHLGVGRMWALRKVFSRLEGARLDLKPH